MVTISTIITIATAAVLAVGAFLYAVCPPFKEWLIGLFKGQQPDDTTLKENPTIRGTSNQLATNKVVPITLGKRLMTPYVCGKSYTESKGAYGENQYINVLFMLGYAPLQVTDIKLKYGLLAGNKYVIGEGDDKKEVAIVRNGKITLQPNEASPYASFWKNGDIQLEVQQEDECSLYNQKVIQDDVNAQIIKVSGESPLEITRYSAEYPIKIEVEIMFQGLYSLNDKGQTQHTEVQVQVQYSFTGSQDEAEWFPICFSGGSNEPFNYGSHEVTYSTFANYGKFIEIASGQTPPEDYSFQYTTTRHIQDSRKEIQVTNQASGITSFCLDSTKTMYFTGTVEFNYEQMKDTFADENTRQPYVYIRVKRLTNDSTNSKTCNKVYLSAIRSWCFDPVKSKADGKNLIAQIPVEEELRKKTVRLAMRIKASEGLKGNIDSLNCILQSETKTWDGTKWSEELSATSNPASLALSMFDHPCLGQWKYDLNLINLEKFGEFYEFCEKSKYECNAILINQLKFGDLIAQILECGHAFPVLNDSKYTLFIDKKNDLPVTILNNHNILKDGFSNTKNFDEQIDGVIVSFYNKDTDYKKDTIKVLYDNSKINEKNLKFEQVQLEHITDPSLAWRFGKYNLAKRILRPETWTRKVSVDGELISVGDLVEIQDDSLSVGIGDGGIIRKLNYDSNKKVIGFISDCYILFSEIDKEYGVKIIHTDDNNAPIISTCKLVVTDAKMYQEFTFEQPITEHEIALGDICAFGFFESITTKAICIGKNHNDDNSFDLMFVPYQDAIYNYDDPTKIVDEIPAFQSNVNIQSDLVVTENNDEKLTIDNVNQIVGDIVNANSEIVGKPLAPRLTSVIATEKNILVTYEQDGYGRANDIESYVIELSKDAGNNWEVVGNTNERFFNYKIDWFAESRDLENYRFRVYCVNKNAEKISPFDKHASPYSDYWSVDLSQYGTWKLEKPVIEIRISDRTITLIMGQPPRSDEKIVYGNIRYKVQVKRFDDNNFYKPATGKNPLPEFDIDGNLISGNEENYKDEEIINNEDFVTTDKIYIQTMPLLGQSTNNIVDTMYVFSVCAYSEAFETEATVVNATAVCTSLQDIVRANEDYKQLYVTQLSAISANLGLIKQGSLTGDDNNYWALSDVFDEQLKIKYRQGAFRLGNRDRYFKVEPKYNYATGKYDDYDISFAVGNFSVDSGETKMTGIQTIDTKDNLYDRVYLSPEKVSLQHRDTEYSEFKDLSKIDANGFFGKSLRSENQLLITNASIDERRKRNVDIGFEYPSENSEIYHFDTDELNQSGTTSLIIENAENGIERRLVGKDDYIDSNRKFLPAILSYAPYSEVGRALFGQYSIEKTFSNVNLFSIDFWIQFLSVENQIIFTLEDLSKTLQILVQKEESFYNEDEKLLYNTESSKAVSESNYKYEIKDEPFFADEYNKKVDGIESVYNTLSVEPFNNSFIYFEKDEDDIFREIKVTPFNYDDLLVSQKGLYKHLGVYNEVLPGDTYLIYKDYSESLTIPIKNIFGEILSEDKNEQKLKSFEWYHFLITQSENILTIYLGFNGRSAKYKINLPTMLNTLSDDKNATGRQVKVIFNPTKKSFLVDELLIDNSVVIDEESFKERTLSKKPFAYLSDKKNWSIFNVKEPELFKTNIFENTQIINLIGLLAVPIGFIYTQYPNQKSPWQMWTFTTVEQWENISEQYADSFFRAESDETGKAQSFENQTSAQKEQVPNVKGDISRPRGQNAVHTWHGDSQGAFWTSGSQNSAYSNSGDGGFHHNRQQMSLSRGQTNANGTYKSQAESSYVDGGEVRPKNYTIRIWKRINYFWRNK